MNKMNKMNKKTKNAVIFTVCAILIMVAISVVNAYNARSEKDKLIFITEPIVQYLDKDLQEYYREISIYFNTRNPEKLQSAKVTENRICEYLRVAYNFRPSSNTISDQYQWLTLLIDDLGTSLDEMLYYAQKGDKFHLIESSKCSKRCNESIKTNIKNLLPVRDN